MEEILPENSDASVYSAARRVAASPWIAAGALAVNLVVKAITSPSLYAGEIIDFYSPSQVSNPPATNALVCADESPYANGFSLPAEQDHLFWSVSTSSGLESAVTQSDVPRPRN
jgi:hypothetical protein